MSSNIKINKVGNFFDIFHLIDLTTTQHSLSNLYYTRLFVISPSPSYKLQRGCVAEILFAFMPDFD